MFAHLPVNALRAFESAARLQSFKRAAAELHVTPTAISHQMKGLEQRLGLALFERRARAVGLTPAGETLFRAVHGAWLDIAQALQRVQPALSASALNVSTTHSYAALWLVPRLGRFHESWPQYQVNLSSTAAVVDLEQDASVDVAIRYGAGVYPGLHRVCALQEHFGVYGAPAVVAAVRPGRRPPLISVRWRDSRLYEQGWRDWCARAGVDWLQAHGPDRVYEEENYALQAAVAGQGLVLASSIMVSDLAARGLLAPCRPELSVPGAAYTALCVPGRERHPPVRAFLQWLQGEMGQAAAG
ncbi:MULTISPECIES: LysR substrate-binding domain-containing protein [Bordetella]|uniref:LysR family transcriptional regulator n=2 Tax=Bordetella TaxID=517 RepID=A0A261VZ27_9BORD|nr:MULTISPECIES: LysR substrate-binding domain-containing protein [Bordetella]MDM9559739.1 LysR substrate-binding domain-containing protein [Bordetella petrii]OZI79368.1 LysR family transcriptional regulator [Bordetella genomosp. 2]